MNRPKGRFSKPGAYNKNWKGKPQFTRKPKLADVINAELEQLKVKYKAIDSTKFKTFSDIPLCQKTLNGLKEAKYIVPTDIQRESIGLSIQGHDILGAAKTGSGKTLAFLIPILERLYREKWTSMDGMGALIISPTRELAYQTFEVLRKIGKEHDFSAGLVIGGKHLREESERINNTNIIVCTPGRLLQHMDETALFTADSLQVLVLDEADRILEMGFAPTMNAIIENLPTERQTILFSATQTKSVKDLARLSLSDPMYVSIHEHAKHSTPVNLIQSYIVCDLHDKLSLLWSFVKNHLKSKILVFMSCCKEVKFITAAFMRMRPGVSVACLNGDMNQLRRVEEYNSFCRKKFAVLFATDIAARGLDFPAVNWVLQLDCPEDATTYIHRVGRTARYEQNGEALLVLMPSEEEAMVKLLEEKKIPINKIRVNTRKISSIQMKIEAHCAADPELKGRAQRAFSSYLRSVFLMSNKAVFDVKKLDIDQFARSFGLVVVPRVKFMEAEEKRRQEAVAKQQKIKKAALEKLKAAEKENTSKQEVLEDTIRDKFCKSNLKDVSTSRVDNSDSDSDDVSDSSDDVSGSSDDVSDSSEDVSDSGSDSSNNSKQSMKPVKDSGFNFDLDEDDGELFVVKRRTDLEADLESSDRKLWRREPESKTKSISKIKKAKKLINKKIIVNTSVKFDDDGNEIMDAHKKPQVLHEFADDHDLGGINIDVARQRLKEEDQFDKLLHRQKIKDRHREKRLKLKQERRKQHMDDAEKDEEDEAVVGGAETDNPLDYIPDPDKIYGRLNSDDGDDDASSYREDSDDERPSNAKKMKLAVSDDSDDGDMDDSDDDDNDNNRDNNVDEEESDDGTEHNVLGVGTSVDMDEEMALRLLHGQV